MLSDGSLIGLSSSFCLDTKRSKKSRLSKLVPQTVDNLASRIVSLVTMLILFFETSWFLLFKQTN